MQITRYRRISLDGGRRQSLQLLLVPLELGHWRGSGERLHYMSLSGCSGATCTGLCSSAASRYLHQKKGAMLVLGKKSQVTQSLLHRNC